MAYYLGKNTNADLSSIMTGAYNMSTGTTALNATSPTASLSGATDVASGQTSGPLDPESTCVKGCANRYRDDEAGYTACVEKCKSTTPNPTPNPTPTPTTTGCPEGSGETYEGCACGRGYATMTGNCPSGYTFIARDPNNWTASDIPVKAGAKGTCECNKAIEDWKANKGGGTLGDYQYPAGMEELMNMLLGRSKELLGTAPGYSQEAIDAMFGQGFENVRGAGAATGNAITDTMAGQGMLGTGTAANMLNRNAWNTENDITNLGRDIMIANENKKKEDLINLSTAAQSLFGSGLGYEQLREAVNSSRRGESSSALAMLLALYQSMLGAAS